WADFHSKGGRKVSVLHPGGRLYHADIRNAVSERPRYHEEFLRACSGCFPEASGRKDHPVPYRLSAYADGRRVHLYVPELQHRARPCLESGKRNQSRPPGESNPGQVPDRLAQLERRLLFQPLLVALGLADLYEGTSYAGVRRDGERRADSLSNGSYAGGEQQLYARGDLYVHQGRVDRFTVLPVQQTADQPDGRCHQGYI